MDTGMQAMFTLIYDDIKTGYPIELKYDDSIRQFINIEVGTIQRNRSLPFGFQDTFTRGYNENLDCQIDDILDYRRNGSMIHNNINDTMKMDIQKQRVQAHMANKQSRQFCFKADRFDLKLKGTNLEQMQQLKTFRVTRCSKWEAMVDGVRVSRTCKSQKEIDDFVSRLNV